MESRALLALGKFRREERAALAVAAQQAAFELHAVDTSDEASDWLSNNDAHAALLESEQCEGLAVEARSSARHVRLPMLALARSVSRWSPPNHRRVGYFRQNDPARQLQASWRASFATSIVTSLTVISE